MHSFRHVFFNGTQADLQPGKIVCVARNYVDHIRELNNEIPPSPVFFIKPSTSLVAFEEGIALPPHGGNCHHELELAVIFGQELSRAKPEEIDDAILGYALGLDLTLRDLQTELKKKGHPWEVAKGFDGSCPLSPLIPKKEITDPQNLEIELKINGDLRQQASTRFMIVPILELIRIASGYFTLLPGDVLLTGTPAGVGPLKSGDQLEMKLAGRFPFQTWVH